MISDALLNLRQEIQNFEVCDCLNGSENPESYVKIFCLAGFIYLFERTYVCSKIKNVFHKGHAIDMKLLFQGTIVTTPKLRKSWFLVNGLRLKKCIFNFQ